MLLFCRMVVLAEWWIPLFGSSLFFHYHVQNLFNKSMNLLLICRSFINVLLFISLTIPPILDITLPPFGNLPSLGGTVAFTISNKQTK